VAKATSVPVAKIAARVMAGEPLARFGLTEPRLQHVAVKEAVLPFARFPGSDVVLGPEMKSTGESMGIDRDFATAYLKAQLGAGGPGGVACPTVRGSAAPGPGGVQSSVSRAGSRVCAHGRPGLSRTRLSSSSFASRSPSRATRARRSWREYSRSSARSAVMAR